MLAVVRKGRAKYLRKRRVSCSRRRARKQCDTLSFPLMKLIPELRLKIYKYHFSQNACQTTATSYYGLLQACRLINHEASPVAKEAYGSQMEARKVVHLAAEGGQKMSYLRELATHPFRAITLCLDLSAASSLRLVHFEIEVIGQILDRKAAVESINLSILASGFFHDFVCLGRSLAKMPSSLPRCDVEVYGNDLNNVRSCTQRLRRNETYSVRKYIHRTSWTPFYIGRIECARDRVQDKCIYCFVRDWWSGVRHIKPWDHYENLQRLHLFVAARPCLVLSLIE